MKHSKYVLSFSPSSANKCLLKVAMYAAQLEQYTKATGIYEEVAKTAMDNPLLKYSAKDYFFKVSQLPCRTLGASVWKNAIYVSSSSLIH